MTSVESSSEKSWWNPNGADTAVLVVQAPVALHGRRLALAEGEQVVGREGPLALKDSTVSRAHARLLRRGRVVWVEDLGSVNGTTVGGRRIRESTAAQDGDLIAFGSVVTVLSVAPSAGDASRPAPTVPRQWDRRSPDAATDTTRYMSARTYVDKPFRDAVLETLVDEPFRALAPEFGVDAPVVARHALAARRLHLGWNVSLIVALLGTLGGVAAALPLPELRAWFAAPSSEAAAQVAARFPWTVLAVGLLACLVAQAVSLFVLNFVVLRQRLTPGRFRPDAAPVPRSERVRARLADVAQRQDGNVVVFSGYLPFVGSGVLVDGGQAAIDIGDGVRDGDGRRREPRLFTSAQLQAELVHQLNGVGLPHLRAEEKLFVQGYDVRAAPVLLPDPFRPPVARTPPEVVRTLAASPESAIRSYVAVEVSGWGGQLVATTYVRSVRVDQALFLEWIVFALMPLRPAFQFVDSVWGSAAAWMLRSAGLALVHVWVDVPTAPARLIREISRAAKRRSRRKEQHRRIAGNFLVDYGAARSLRERAAGEDDRRYFLFLDLQMFAAVTRERIFKVVGTFLEEHDVDTSSFKSVQNNYVYNNNFSRATISGNQGVFGGGTFTGADDRGSTGPGGSAGPKPRT